MRSGSSARIGGDERRSMMPLGRCHSRSTTSGPARRSKSLADCAPMPGSAVTGANSLSRMAGRTKHLYIPAGVAPRAHVVTASSEIRRKRLSFRSWHRGTRESDLILGRFADAYLTAFDEVQLDRYEALLDYPDADIFDWISGRAAPPP